MPSATLSRSGPADGTAAQPAPAPAASFGGAGPLRGFLLWWGQHLRGSLPGPLTSGLSSQRRLLVVADDAAGLALALRRRGSERPLGSFAADAPGAAALRRALHGAKGAPILLRLPAGVLLERDIVLPLSAEPDLESALGYEIDRATPFRPEEIFWSWEIVRRDRGRGRLHVRIRLAPRAAAARATARLAAAGARPALLEGPGLDGASRRIALTGAALPRWQRRTLGCAAAACAVLAIATAAAPFLRQSWNAAELAARIAALRPQVDEVEALRRRLDGAAAGGDAVAAAQAEFGSALGAVSAVTAVLPDDTFLNDLTLKQRQVVLHGRSANAARLIAELSAHPGFRAPVFSAPVTRAAGGGPDVFAIAAEIAPEMDALR